MNAQINYSYAYFDVVTPPDLDTIVYLVDPIGSGTITNNGTVLTPYPNSQIYNNNTLQSIVANPNANFVFSYWESSNNTIANNNAQGTCLLNTTNDTVIAHFVETFTDTLIVITIPAGSGILNVEGDLINTSPFLGVYSLASVLNIEATPNTGNSFDRWELNNQSLPDYNLSTSFVFFN